MNKAECRKHIKNDPNQNEANLPTKALYGENPTRQEVLTRHIGDG